MIIINTSKYDPYDYYSGFFSTASDMTIDFPLPVVLRKLSQDAGSGIKVWGFWSDERLLSSTLPGPEQLQFGVFFSRVL